MIAISNAIIYNGLCENVILSLRWILVIFWYESIFFFFFSELILSFSF